MRPSVANVDRSAVTGAIDQDFSGGNQLRCVEAVGKIIGESHYALSSGAIGTSCNDRMQSALRAMNGLEISMIPVGSLWVHREILAH